jgi:hypothetical protein
MGRRETMEVAEGEERDGGREGQQAARGGEWRMAHGMHPRRSGMGGAWHASPEKRHGQSGEGRASQRISTRVRTSGRGALNEASGRIGRSSCIITEKKAFKSKKG